MGIFTKIKESTFNELQFDAGMVLKNFDPSDPKVPNDEDIVCATTGGINASCVPTFVDLGEDVDNCPNNMKEFKEIDQWEAKMTFTALSMTEETIKLSLGAATASGNEITPNNSLKDENFKDIWWVGDVTGGGFAAVCLENALSTGGFSLQTTKKGKGNLAVDLTGHYSIDAQDEVPMKFYVGTIS